MPKRISNDNLILFGGGIDSACLARHLCMNNIDFDLLTINYGQKAWVGELHAANYFGNLYYCAVYTSTINAYDHLTHPMLKRGLMAIEHNHNVIPLRNQTLIDEAIRFAIINKYKNIYLGFHIEPKESKFYDAMPEFLEAFQRLIDCQHIGIELKAPFKNTLKEDYLRLLSDTELLNTYSCYESGTINECGRCTHCKQKQEIFKAKGLSFIERRY